MTREEAIAFGKRVIDLGFNGETHEFCKMAIEALEHEPCEDAISRQAVLDKLNRLIEVERLQGTDEMGYGRERVSAYECMIHAVESEYLYPTIQPQPKTGHWIEIAQYSDAKHKIECSECGNHIIDRGHANSFNVKNKYKYCPNCGCRMESKDEVEK